MNPLKCLCQLMILSLCFVVLGDAAPATGEPRIINDTEVSISASRLLNNSTIPSPSTNLVNHAFNLQAFYYDPKTAKASSFDVLPEICNFYHFTADYGRPLQALIGTIFGREACLMWYMDPVCNQTQGWNITEYEDMSEALKSQVKLNGTLHSSIRGDWIATFPKGTTAVQCRYCMYTWFHDILLWRMSYAAISPTRVQALQFGIAVESDKVVITSTKPPGEQCPQEKLS
ncbi:hypothetical protein BDV96DRAFT_642612 [Lophiotrema nucula]|uniref:Uncharacterized protein n=1 Tax=Lophiotrema nucula TaxID=690887 RepID=A0A6A5ZL60_9PLEO|nr:hypothetical protein BDV96DRAFT_642612 [Lophiotrema nucula]